MRITRGLIASNTIMGAANMARPLRLEFPGALYHLTARGNARARIYVDDQDRIDFLERLGETCERFNWRSHVMRWITTTTW
jgi:hypothetical protein